MKLTWKKEKKTKQNKVKLFATKHTNRMQFNRITTFQERHHFQSQENLDHNPIIRMPLLDQAPHQFHTLFH